MIDADAFAEWVLAKAEKTGALLDVENLERAKRAVALALDRPGEEIHVACEFRTRSAVVQCDERMTRMAVEVLFPKVAMSHPAESTLRLRDEKRDEPPKKKTPPPPPPREDDDRREISRDQRRVLIIVFGVILCIIVSTIVATAVKEAHRDDEPARHEKHESRHGN